MANFFTPFASRRSRQAGDRLSPADRELLDKINSLQQEAQMYRGNSDVGMSLEAEWELSGHRFLGNHWNTPTSGKVGLTEGYRVFQFTDTGQGLMGLKRSTLNRTQGSIISNTASETMQPITVRLEPTESRDTTQIWMTMEGGKKLHRLMHLPMQEIDQDAEAATAEVAGDPESVQAIRDEAEQAKSQHLQSFGFVLAEQKLIGPAGPTEAMTESEKRQIMSMIEQGTLDRSDIHIINDTAVTEVAQAMMDNRLSMAQFMKKSLTNEFLSNIFGTQWLRMQWHHDGPMKHAFTLENTHILNVWIDHTHDDISESDYVIFDHCISEDQAIAAWPKFKDDIKKASSEGTLDDKRFRRGGLWRSQQFKRKMVCVRTAWLRWQEVPMTEDEAMESGQVMRIEQVEGGEDGVPVSASVRWALVETAGPGGVPAPGSETTPPGQSGSASANWPKVTGIRQITYLPQIPIKIEDVRCPYWDIPMCLNVNIPRPDGSPYGQGEPLRLEDVSQQINRLLSILDNHSRWYQFVSYFWPADILERLRSGGFQFHSRPGAHIPLPRQDWLTIMRNGGFDSMRMEVPVIPPSYVNLLDRLLSEHDRLSGNVDVRQGTEPFSGASGVAIDSLRAEAQGPLAFKAKFTEMMVARLARLAIDAMVKWLPESEWLKVISRYELPVMREILRRMKPDQMNIRVETASGRGINARIDRQEAIALYDRGSPQRLLSRATAMQRVRIADPDAEARRVDKENAEQFGVGQGGGAGGISLASVQGAEEQVARSASPTGVGGSVAGTSAPLAGPS